MEARGLDHLLELTFEHCSRSSWIIGRRQRYGKLDVKLVIQLLCLDFFLHIVLLLSFHLGGIKCV